MDFLIVIISLSLFVLYVDSNLKAKGVCPNKQEPHYACSSIQECPKKKFTCYRDVHMQLDDRTMFGCCDAHCPETRMPYGHQYLEDSQSTISYCSEPNEHFYIDKTKAGFGSLNEEYGCCPKPYSEFSFGKRNGLLVEEKYALPAGWSLDPKSGEVLSELKPLKQCCFAEDCEQSQYCGRVRNPGTMNLVDNENFTCPRKSDFDRIDGYLKFCYEYPPLNYTSLRIPNALHNTLKNHQLCNTSDDCWNSTQYCKDSIDGGPLGSCAPIIGDVVNSIGAKDAFLVHGSGCSSHEECDDLGLKWFSYQCETPKPEGIEFGKVCVGYEILCSESALYQRGTHFGCENNKDCEKGLPEGDSVHMPLCVENPFLEEYQKETTCCYEMKSCKYHLDITPYGLPPLRNSMCNSNEDCQELADDMAMKSGKRDIYLGRCMPEMENNFGKCCISDISSYCSIGKSLLPPQNCSSHSDCGWSDSRKSWCGDEGYCCEDFEGERSWMCPDGKTIRVEQPKCEANGGYEDGNWCTDRSGYCIMNRCCPAVKPSGDFTYIWAETPWYYDNLTCEDTVDIPSDMNMVYCDPVRKVVTGVSRGDALSARTEAAFYTYCESNQDCTDISDSLICVQETNGLNRCHTYYERSLKWYVFIFPSIIPLFLIYKFIRDWRDDMRFEAKEQTEVYR